MIYIKSLEMLRDYIPFNKDSKFEFKSINLLCGDQGCGKSTLIDLMKSNLTNKTEKEVPEIVDWIQKMEILYANDNRRLSKLKSIKDIDLDKISPNEIIDIHGSIQPIKNLHGKIIDIDNFDQVCRLIENSNQVVCHVERSIPKPNGFIYFSPELHNPRTVTDIGQATEGDLINILKFINYASDLGVDSEHLNRIYDDFRRSQVIYGRVAINEMDILTSRMKSHGQVILPLLKQLTDATDCVIFVDEPETALSIRSQIKLADSILSSLDRGCQVFAATHSPILMDAIGEVLSLEHGKWMSATEFKETQYSSFKIQRNPI